MFIKNLPYIRLLLFILSRRVFVVIRANNWLFIWVGLELNLLSFIPIISASNNNETEAIVKYFLIQAVASIFFFISIIYNHLFPTRYFFLVTLLLRIIIKLGAAPCHFWFPIVINSMTWFNCIVLSTIQKISPIVIVSFIASSLNYSIIFPLVVLNSLVGGLGGVNQTLIRPLIAYSSIVHISWLFGLVYISSFAMILYLIFYIIILSSLFFLILNISKNSIFQFNLKNNTNLPDIVIIFFSLLSLAGLPPLFGFLPKWLAIFTLSYRNQIIILFILLIGTLISLFYYLRIFFLVFTNRAKSITKTSFFPISYTLNLSTFRIIIFLRLNLFYAMIIFNKS